MVEPRLSSGYFIPNRIPFRITERSKSIHFTETEISTNVIVI